VLDLCCGGGASAIPAARAVAPDGRVLALDVAEPLLALARADREGTLPVEFRLADATRTGLPDGTFDAVVCVFGVFFAPDMTAFVREMWRLLAPGGTLAVTTWGPGLWAPATDLFWAAVGEVDAGLVRAFNPWDELGSEDLLVALLDRAGVPDGEAELVPGAQPIGVPEDFWDVVLGSGLRATLDALPAERVAFVHDRVLGALRRTGTRELRTDVIFGRASRDRA
jgi:SAM-dependent methyltransferase